ncbi:DivIVA domain-containing protein [Micromonospora sp. NPDC048871]|uniref:DivIVA domain-containing protein n=1 Tax=unclassified Micromonospora TaxID=2617518 RepID=UPI002E0D10D8|nr:DivIVA domain-containing protein [Micromonospora sp. NBC_01739]
MRTAERTNSTSRSDEQRGESVGTCYRAASFRPWQVRDRRFRLSRRGYDPAEVVEFLDRVADDLEAAYAQVAQSHREAARVREALRQWQAEWGKARQGGANHRPVYRQTGQQPANQGAWR